MYFVFQTLRKGIMTMDQDGVLGRDEIVLQVKDFAVNASIS